MSEPISADVAMQMARDTIQAAQQRLDDALVATDAEHRAGLLLLAKSDVSQAAKASQKVLEMVEAGACTDGVLPDQMRMPV